jgi:hypothetical protein
MQAYQRETAVYVGSPGRYIDQAANGPAMASTPNNYSVVRGAPNDMWNQPAKRFYPPMGPNHTSPNADEMERFQFTGPDGSLPTFFPVGNRAAVTVHDTSGGKREGLRMLIISPARYNAAVLTRHTIKDTRLLPGRSGRPSRRYVPGVPVGG